jgi:hypothetical protein
MNILIGTLILWILTALFVVPLAEHWTKKKLEEPQYAHLRVADPEQLSEEQQAALRAIGVKNYIVADLLVLGIAGLIGGLVGFWFLGFSFKLEGWPGMIAFIGASFLGFAIHNAFVM